MTFTANNIQWQTAKGWLKDGERSLLFELASRLPGNAVILNIGVEFGASLACLRAGNPTALIYGVDLDISKAVSDYAGCLLLQEDSHQLVKEWKGSIDLIFVDGDHGEAGVLLDAGFADFLPVGGWILFQDVYDWDKPGEIHGVCPGVYAAVEKWSSREDIKTEFEELPSVDTTRVFRRVKAYEQPAGVAGSGRVDTNLREAGNIRENTEPTTEKSQISRQGRNSRRR